MVGFNIPYMVECCNNLTQSYKMKGWLFQTVNPFLKIFQNYCLDPVSEYLATK